MSDRYVPLHRTPRPNQPTSAEAEAEAIARLRLAATLDEAVDYGGVRVRLADLRVTLDAHAALAAAHEEALDALDDLVSLAGSAMAQANNDGAEYDAKAELEDALAVLVKAGRR